MCEAPAAKGEGRVPCATEFLITPHTMSIVLTDFARPRLFPRVPRGNTIQDCTAEQFEAYLNAHAPVSYTHLTLPTTPYV